ncbi:hypothetical protein [Formosa haliotis]|uniref:hypothetical protein n=1 Tax=Formosa haliotis TaxID=1555194 RepID=UPI000824D843|nr:hypothetical protein [Formosa haliotis]
MDKLKEKLFYLYSELISLDIAFEHKKEIDFSRELNTEIDYRSKIIKKTNSMFSSNFISAIKSIEDGKYLYGIFLDELFESILNVDFLKQKIQTVDLYAIYTISKNTTSEFEFIEKVKNQVDLVFLVDLIEATQLLNSYDYYLNNKPKKNKVNIFINDLIKGISHLQEELDLTVLQKIFSNKKSESLFRDNLSFYLKGAGYKTISESKKGANRIDLKIYKNLDVYKAEFKGWWNNDKKEIVSQINQYLTDFDEYGFIFMINDKQKRIKDEYFELIKRDSSDYIKNSLKTITIDNFKFYHSSHYFGDNAEKKLFHFIFNIYKN